jgi:hypothetical protein
MVCPAWVNPHYKDVTEKHNTSVECSFLKNRL